MDFDFSVIDETTWRFLEVVGIWFAGAATFCAVLVSLYLSWNSSQAKLIVNAGSRTLVGDGINKEFLTIGIVNVGLFPARVVSHGFTIGVFSKQRFIVFQDVIYSDQLPRILNAGEALDIRIPYTTDSQKPLMDALQSISSDTVKWYQPLWLVLWSFRVEVCTATNQTFGGRVEKSLRSQIKFKRKSAK